MTKTIELRQLLLQMRPPGETEWIELSNDASDPKRAWTINAVNIAWQRTSPRDHPEPGEYSLDLLMYQESVDASILEYDTEVKLAAYVLDPEPPQHRWPILLHGWVTSWTRGLPRADGRCIYHLGIIDPVGRAAAITIGDEPWPHESGFNRGQRLNKLSPSGPIIADDLPGNVGPRDVDNVALLDVARATCPPGYIIGIDEYDTSKLAAQPSGSLQYQTLTAVKLPASIIEDTGRQLDRSATLTEIGITAHWNVDKLEEKATRTIYGSNRRGYTSSRWSIDTDQTYLFDDTRKLTLAWAKRTIDESAEPAIYLPGSPRILLNRNVAVGNICNLLHAGTRYNSAIEIIDPPSDLDPVHLVIGGSIEVKGMRIKLRLSLVPAGVFGVRRVRWKEVNLAISPGLSQRTRYDNWEGGWLPARFEDFANMSIT